MIVNTFHLLHLTFNQKKECHHAEAIIVSLFRKHFPCHRGTG